jgi:predicted metal-dependent hydrolase
MKSTLTVAEIDVDVELKPIKNTHLSVYPPGGRVVLSAPLSSNRGALRAFVIKHLSWIREQRARLLAQPREQPSDFIDRESHYLWGRRYLLANIVAARPSVEISGRWLKIAAPESYDTVQRAKAFDVWRRAQLRVRAEPMVAAWSQRLNADVSRFYIQKMRTKWGSATPSKRVIRLNLELVRFTPDCLDYVIAHEIAHFHAPDHSVRFRRLLDDALPGWEALRSKLQRMPLAA